MTVALSSAERVSLSLRELYQTYGYRQYRVSKFEEYDFYAQNRNFLSGDHILTFNDTDGKLMALKPDITLSIIKNTRDDTRMRKVWYTENVYRVPHGAYGFQEILQTGLECMGDIDSYAMAEVLMLAACSLKSISSSYVIDLSHIGILTGILHSIDASPSFTASILNAFSEKNLHALRAVCEEADVDSDISNLFAKLCLLGGSAKDTITELLSLPLPSQSMEAASELQTVCLLLSKFGDYNVNLDLSVVNDTDYYNGLIFHGFVDGVASSVLSGGQYDHLLARMGKTGGAIGFAVYLSELERLLSDPRDYDVDVLLLYDDSDDPAEVIAAAKAIVEKGQSVRVQHSGTVAVTYRQKIRTDGTEVS